MADKSLIQDLSMEEVGGAIVGLRRRVLVKGLSTKSYAVLSEALAHPDVPAANSSPPEFPNLVLTKRLPKLSPDSQSVVEVELEYESRKFARFNREEFQFRVSGGTALRSIETQFDAYGDQIVLQHTFPADDPDYPSETKDQGGTISVLRPQTTIVFQGVLRTAYPHYISSWWSGYLNSYYWAGGAPYTWMCTDVRWDLLDTSGDGVYSTLDFFMPVWNFTFEFLYDSNTHIPVAVFNDPRDNRPPINLVANTGYKAIDAYPLRDFNELFPV